MRQALLIEDAAEYQLLVRVALAEQFHVTSVVSAEEALSVLEKKTFDIILVDVGLPGKTGLAFCEEIRKSVHLQQTPILFVTGKTETTDIVQGFAAGGDDYIVKPFHPEELKARVEARFKRAGAQTVVSQDHFWKADLRFSIGRQRVTQTTAEAERDLELTPNEFKILYFLAKHDGRTLTRTEILHEVWGANLHVIERTVDKHICSLRRKMGTRAQCLASVPGKGYTFKAPANADEIVPKVQLRG